MLNQFSKYFSLLKLSWQDGLVYRTSLIMWRVRNLLSTLAALTIWSVIFTNQTTVFNYQQPEMITYIFLTSILQSFILSTALHGLAQTIYSGSISLQLVKPINIYVYLASQDIADKIKNVVFVLFEALILYTIFKPIINFPSVANGIFFLFFATFGAIMHYLINLLFGAIGFWSPDVWGPKFLFFMFVDFTAGKLYPLDILPKMIQKIIFFTPFPYLSYTQVQIYLGRLNTTQIFSATVTMISWIGILGISTYLVWKKGLKDYTAVGQ